MEAVRLTDVTKTFGSTVAVDALDLTVRQGSIHGFIGPNGSGKTTTLRMILHIIHPDRGSIEVLGETGTRAANDRVGYLPEERGLYKKMTVRQLLGYYAALKGMSPRDAKAQSTHWLERLGLASVGKNKVETLSKGMAQKVQFIATVLTRPELIILDEPFSGLDPVNLEALREAILELNREGTTVIFSTHDMLMAERMCDSVFMIFRGAKVLDGTMAEIQRDYGADTVHLRMSGGRELVSDHPAVDKVTDLGQVQEVRLAGDPQALLRDLVQRTEVQHFEITKPSLHDIFIRIAGPEAVAAVAADADAALLAAAEA